MKILYLTLNKKWFDMILSGEKTEEYREIKKYWYIRLKANIAIDPETDQEYYWFNSNFDFIEFTNGYSKLSRRMVVECKGIEEAEGNINWGAEAGVKYFVIKLGKITDTKNC